MKLFFSLLWVFVLKFNALQRPHITPSSLTWQPHTTQQGKPSHSKHRVLWHIGIICPITPELTHTYLAWKQTMRKSWVHHPSDIYYSGCSRRNRAKCQHSTAQHSYSPNITQQTARRAWPSPLCQHSWISKSSENDEALTQFLCTAPNSRKLNSEQIWRSIPSPLPHWEHRDAIQDLF